MPETPVKPTKPAKAKKTAAASPSVSVPSLTKVPEKKLKGQDISYGVQFGPARAVIVPPSRPNPNSRGWYLLDDRNKPFMTFRFLYRSEKALQSLGILPREDALRPEFKVSLITVFPARFNCMISHIDMPINSP